MASLRLAPLTRGRRITGLTSALVLALLGCRPAPGPVDTAPGDPPGGQRSRVVSVVASFYPLAEFSRRVGGDRVTVTNLTPAGAEPHDLELAPRDVERLRTADLVVHNGLGFQPALDKVLATVVDTRRTRVVDATEGIDLPAAEKAAEGGTDGQRGEGPSGERMAGRDWHVWLDPLLAERQISAIVSTLSAVDPEGAGEYGTRGRAVREELRVLDARYAAGLAQCERRDVVTMHAAFAYLARRYGLQQVALAGASPEGEPSPQQMGAVLRFIRERDVRAIFVEPLASQRAAEVLAQEARVMVLRLNPIESLTREEEVQGENYFTVMLANLDALRRGLGCR